jgi:putative two-component system response regulator
MTELSSGLRAIFETNKHDFQQRVSTLEEAVAAILAGSLDERLRTTAEQDAHKLVGSLGSFGRPRGSELARELELRLAPGHRSVMTDDAHLAECVAALRGEVESRGSLETGLAATDPVAVASGRILVVDDDVPVRRLLAAILSEAGYDVRDVSSAREARHALEHDTIALLLSDVNMPGETGLDLIRFALCEHPETATLLISVLDDPAVAQVGMDCGAYGYLSKPVRRSAVLIAVMNALRRRDMEARERGAREDLERTLSQRTIALSQALVRLDETAEQRRVLQAESMHRWAQFAEWRDPAVGAHVKRVSRYCAMLARAFGMHPRSLELASLLHDVGKIAIPDSILLKPAALTGDERLAIETHADTGYQMLRDSHSSMFDLASVIARTHHEKYDGSGYPRGLAGANIPLEGRIAAVADVFDALTCDRVHRPAWSVESTVAYMRRERGKHFDPSVLDAFLSSMDEILAIRSALPSR